MDEWMGGFCCCREGIRDDVVDERKGESSVVEKALTVSE